MDVSNLVALAGNTLVAAAVTDAWEMARQRFTQLFGRGTPDPTTGRRLEATRSQLAAAAPAELVQAQTDLAGQWALRLSDLLEEDPDAEAELRALVEEIGAMLPAGAVSAAGYSVAAGGDVSIRADHGRVAAAVIHGNVGPPGPTGPGLAETWPGLGLVGIRGRDRFLLIVAGPLLGRWCSNGRGSQASRCDWQTRRRSWLGGRSCSRSSTLS